MAAKIESPSPEIESRALENRDSYEIAVLSDFSMRLVLQSDVEFTLAATEK